MGWLLTLLIVAGAGGAAYWFILREDGSSAAVVPLTSVVDVDAPTTAGIQPVAPAELSGVPYIGPLKFQWPRDCLVPVREVVTKGGSTAEVAYGLSIVGEGENLVVSFAGMTVSTVNGSPVTGDAADQATAGFLLPSFVVGPDGSVVEVRGMAALIAEFAARDPDFVAKYTPEEIAGLESLVIAKYWDSWVGFWASLGSVDEPRLEATSPSNSSGLSFDTTLVVESLGTGADGQIRLRQVQTLDGENFLRALSAALPEINSDPTAAGRRITTVDVTTDPLTLRSSSIVFTNDTQLTTNGQTQSDLETRRWTIDWATANCS